MTGNEAIEQAIRVLLGGSREEMNKLAANVSSGATTLTFTYPLGAIREGAQICIGNEMFRVWSVDDSAKTVVVEPGISGSTTAAHTQNDLVYVNPRFARFAALEALNQELRSLSSPANGLYQMVSYEFDYNASVTDYGLPTTAIDVYDAIEKSIGPSDSWPRLPLWDWNPSANTDDFVTGKSIHLPVGTPSRTVRVLVKSAFTTVTDPTQDLSDAGLPLEMHDLAYLGILMRLGPSREIKRNFTEAQGGDARRYDEVPAGAITNSFAWVRSLRDTRITEERLRLERLYPPKRVAQ